MRNDFGTVDVPTLNSLKRQQKADSSPTNAQHNKHVFIELFYYASA